MPLMRMTAPTPVEVTRNDTVGCTECDSNFAPALETSRYPAFATSGAMSIVSPSSATSSAKSLSVAGPTGSRPAYAIVRPSTTSVPDCGPDGVEWNDPCVPLKRMRS